MILAIKEEESGLNHLKNRVNLQIVETQLKTGDAPLPLEKYRFTTVARARNSTSPDRVLD
jgi:hypothetical protein